MSSSFIVDAQGFDYKRLIMTKNIVHVVGTGTIGEPLIGILCDYKKELGIDEVTFNKNTPHVRDKAKVNRLIQRGAKMSSLANRKAEFKELGNEVTFESEEAIARASVVIDCTPSGIGAANKAKYYEKYVNMPNSNSKGFIAQGSEFGFGKMYAYGINDETLVPNEYKFIHIVSCNTHNLSVLLESIGDPGNGSVEVDEGKFLCLRRANDISMDDSFIPAPQVGNHSDPKFGTHHARDAYHLFKTKGLDLDLYSSAVKLNTQYMHAVHFSIKVPFKTSLEKVMASFTQNDRIALTHKISTNMVFSFGREHGHYGRILNQTVVSVPSLAVRNENEVVGFCFTPQDGNSLLSSVAATLWYLDAETMKGRMACLNPYLFNDI